MKILIVKASSLGDILHCFPIIGYLRRAFPMSVIDWAIEKKWSELLNAHPSIRRVISLETKRWRTKIFSLETYRACCRVRRQLRLESYDHILDLQGNIKSALVTACAQGKAKAGFSFKSAPEWPASLVLSHRYTVPSQGERSKDYLALVQRHLQRKVDLDKRLGHVDLTICAKELEWITSYIQQRKGLYVMVCPGSNWENKKLSFGMWCTFLTAIAQKLSSHFLCAWGTKGEKKEAEALASYLGSSCRVLPRLRLPVWQRLMGKVDLVIAVDSSALHLAATTSTPSFGVFGPSSARCYNPKGKERGFFQGGCPYGENFITRCSKLRRCLTGACLKEVTAEKLTHTFFSWWSRLS